MTTEKQVASLGDQRPAPRDLDARRDQAARLRELLRVLREQILLVVLVPVVAAVAAWIISSFEDPTYEATSRVYLTEQSPSAGLLEGAGASFEGPEVRAATDLDFATLPVIAERVREDLGLETSPDELMERIETENRGNSRILAFTVRAGDAETAADVANSFAEHYREFRREVAVRRYKEALELVEDELRTLRATGDDSEETTERIDRLAEQATQLELASRVLTSDVEVVQSASPPSSAVAPMPRRTAILGGLAGLALGLGLAFLRDRLDQRVKSEDAVDRLLPGTPIVGRVPDFAGAGRRQVALADAFRTLRTNLSFAGVGRQLRTLLVTSGTAGDGKSTVALNLALTMAERGEPTLLVDADLRRPTLSKRLGLSASRGLSTFLSRQDESLEDIMFGVSVDADVRRAADGPAAALTGVLDVVPSGPLPPNPQVLLGAGALDGFLQGAADETQVILDGSPLGPVADVLPVAERVDGVIVVVRLYHTSDRDLKRLRWLLEQAGVEPLGIVIVGGESATVSEYYGV